ncbi:MAG: hypothetical protein AAGU27_12175 [Dehalobacterium sp.]
MGPQLAALDTVRCRGVVTGLRCAGVVLGGERGRVPLCPRTHVRCHRTGSGTVRARRSLDRRDYGRASGGSCGNGNGVRGADAPAPLYYCRSAAHRGSPAAHD